MKALLAAIFLIGSCALMAAPTTAGTSYIFRADVVDFDHSLEFDVHTPGGHLEAQVQWQGGREGTGTLYIVQEGVAECSVAGAKVLRCTVSAVYPEVIPDLAPEGWYEVEVSVQQTWYPPLSNVAVKVSGDIDAVLPPD